MSWVFIVRQSFKIKKCDKLNKVWEFWNSNLCAFLAVSEQRNNFWRNTQLSHHRLQKGLYRIRPPLYVISHPPTKLLEYYERRTLQTQKISQIGFRQISRDAYKIRCQMIQNLEISVTLQKMFSLRMCAPLSNAAIRCRRGPNAFRQLK